MVARVSDSAVRAISPLRPLHTVIAINVAIIITGLKDGGDDCFNIMDEPTILVSLAFNFVLGKCAIPDRVDPEEAHILHTLAGHLARGLSLI